MTILYFLFLIAIPNIETVFLFFWFVGYWLISPFYVYALIRKVLVMVFYKFIAEGTDPPIH